MNKKLWLLSLVPLMLPTPAFADDLPEATDAPEAMTCCCGRMECGGMSTTMIAADDGGVIVLTGRKLQKYDSALKFIKEVDLWVDDSSQEGSEDINPGIRASKPL